MKIITNNEILTDYYSYQPDIHFILLTTKLTNFFGTIIRVHLQPK